MTLAENALVLANERAYYHVPTVFRVDNAFEEQVQEAAEEDTFWVRAWVKVEV